jgi:hypothetical protein
MTWPIGSESGTRTIGVQVDACWYRSKERWDHRRQIVREDCALIPGCPNQQVLVVTTGNLWNVLSTD